MRSAETYPQQNTPPALTNPRQEEIGTTETESQSRPKRRTWPLWIALLIVVAGAAVGIRQYPPPLPVQLIQPELREVTETLSASGLVGGQHETSVGSQAQGVVEELSVKEGDVVRQGEVLAHVQNSVALAQVHQAEQALAVAKAQLAQAEQGAQPSQIQAAQARVQQAEAGVGEQQAHLAHNQAALQQAETTIARSAAQKEQAQAVVLQAEARLVLAQKTLERYQSLRRQGAVAQQAVDQLEADYHVAQQEVAGAQQGVATAEADLAAAHEAQKAAQQDITAVEAQIQAGRSAVKAAQADLETLHAQPRPEDVRVARQRMREVEEALLVARAQAQSAVIRAPFAGTVTQIVAEVGASVGAGGVLRLVQTGRPEIRIHVDENNLAELRVGQKAILSSSAFRETQCAAHVNEIGAQVDSARGTVEVTLMPDAPPNWLRPGQTVNVNLLLAEHRQRLLIPVTAIRMEGEKRTVLVMQDDRAVAKLIVTGPETGGYVPVLEGLTSAEQIVRNAEKVTPGKRVRVTRGK